MTEVPNIQTNTTGLFDKAVLLKMTFAKLGNRRKVASAFVKAGDADTSMLSVSKRLLESDALDAILKHDSEVRAYVVKRSVPSNFRSGVYLYPIALVVETNKHLDESSELRADLVEKFIEDYERAVNDARERLGELFNETDYKSVDDVRRAFGFSFTWIEAGPANKLKALSAAMFEAEKEKFESEMRDALEEAKQLLRQGFADLVTHMADRLEPTADGKRKVFRDSLVGNMREFFEVFDARNLAEDEDLTDLVTKARALLDGVSADELRENETLRDKVHASIKQMMGTLDGMVIDKPSRKLRLDEESEEEVVLAEEPDPLEVL